MSDHATGWHNAASFRQSTFPVGEALISSMRTIAALPSNRVDRWRWQADVIVSPSLGVISFRNPHEQRYQAMMARPLSFSRQRRANRGGSTTGSSAHIGREAETPYVPGHSAAVNRVTGSRRGRRHAFVAAESGQAPPTP